MGDKKGFSMVFAVVSLLNCCQASNFFLPRVSRTNDAIIIDLDGSGYDAPFQSKSWYGQIANPGFIPVPSFNPYPMMLHQQRPSGWPYPSNKQFDREDHGEDEEEKPIDVKQATATCGGGPATMPASRGLISERVAGGTDSIPRAWPFLVNLKKASDPAFFCTGTLVSDRKVLTAARCLKQLSLVDISGLNAWFGTYLGDKSDVKMTRRIITVVFHSGYNAVTNANDIAILTLDTPVILSKIIAPACLPPASTNPDQYVGQNAMILGWGSANPIPPVLQQAKVSILSKYLCTFDPTIGTYVTVNTLCVTSNTNNKFTCKEDLGGPVVILPSPGAWTVVGINSYPQGCNSNGLKTRVSAYRTWINQYIP